MGIEDSIKDVAEKVGLGDHADKVVDAADVDKDGDLDMDDAKGLMDKAKDMIPGKE